MEHFDDNELDKAFREGIEHKGLTPPPMLWKEVRGVALEKQLITHKITALWLKGIVSALVIVSGGLGYIAYEAKQTNDFVAKQIKKEHESTREETPTVGAEKLQISAENIPQNPTLIAKEQALTQKERELETTALLLATKAKIFAKKEEELANKNAEIAIKEQQILKGEQPFSNQYQKISTPQKLSKNQADEPIIGQALPTTNTEKTTIVYNVAAESEEYLTKPNKDVLNTATTTSVGKMQQSFATKYQQPEQITSSLLPNIAKNSTNVAPSTENRLVINLSALSIRLAPLETEFNQPQITKKHWYIADRNRKPVVIPFWRNLTLSAYIMPENNSLDIRRNEPRAFNFANQTVSSNTAFGAILGYKIGNKFSVKAGIEYNQNDFEEKIKYSEFKTEKIGNNTGNHDGFLYRTALGIAEITTNELGFFPHSDDKIIIENTSSQTVSFWRIPVSASYNFMSWGKKNVQFNLYGIAGASLVIPEKQDATIIIYLPNGREIERNLSNFQNTQTAFNLNIGGGIGMSFRNKWQLFTEPIYALGLTSLVKNMPIQTYTNALSIRLGLGYSFGKK